MTKKKTAKKKTATKKRPKIRLMFIHRCEGTGGKTLNMFYRVLDDDGREIQKGEDGQPIEHLYDRNAKGIRRTPLSNPMCGGVYAVEHDKGDEGGVYPGTADYVGRATHDRATLVRWQSIDQAQRDTAAARKAEKKKHSRDYVLETLEPIRSAYLSMRGAQRAVFLARVVKHITGTS